MCLKRYLHVRRALVMTTDCCSQQRRVVLGKQKTMITTTDVNSTSARTLLLPNQPNRAIMRRKEKRRDSDKERTNADGPAHSCNGTQASAVIVRQLSHFSSSATVRDNRNFLFHNSDSSRHILIGGTDLTFIMLRCQDSCALGSFTCRRNGSHPGAFRRALKHAMTSRANRSY